MKINIHGDKIKITKPIKEYVEKKLSKIDKYFEDADNITAHVRARVKDYKQIIEVTIPIHKVTIRAEESHTDLYAAIDIVVDKVERQIRKNKTKLNNKYKTSDVVDFNFDFEEEPDEMKRKIVRRKNIESKPMNEEEAILQMDLLGHDFFVFKNIDEECVSVIYVRKDGNYGIINVK